MSRIPEIVQFHLETDMVIDITTTGRRTGLPRRIEIWAHYMRGKIFIASRPGKRSWHSNMISNKNFMIHFKGTLPTNLPAIARPVFDKSEREEIFGIIRQETSFEERKNMVVNEWAEMGCLVEATLK